jgi:hypothetical protein
MDPLPYEYELGVYEKLTNILETRQKQYFTSVMEDMAFLNAEQAKPTDVPHLRSFGSPDHDLVSELEWKAREYYKIGGEDHRRIPDAEVVEWERQLLLKSKSKPDGIEQRLFIHIVRLRLQEKLILRHHLAEIKKQLVDLEEQYARRMRILRRAPVPEAPK